MGQATPGAQAATAHNRSEIPGLRLIYDALLTTVASLGDDIEVSPKKGYVNIRRRKQCAIIQLSTSTRLGVGLNLKGVVPVGRLEEAGSFDAMVSHRVKLDSIKGVDAALRRWLRQAYELA